MKTTSWEPRDFPVLRAIVELYDEGNYHIEPGRIQERTGLDETTVQLALWALAGEEPRLFDFSNVTGINGPPEMIAIRRPTGHARRTVGTWPTPDGLTDRIIAALEDVAANAPSKEERTRAQRMLEGAKGVGRGVLTGVLVKVLTTGV